MKPGDRIEVRWLDIHQDSTGDPCALFPAEFVTRGYYVGYSGRGKRRFLRISDTRRIDKTEWYGGTAIPRGCILSISRRER